MKADTYNSMKNSFNKLYKLVDKLSSLWGHGFSHLVTVSVILQNMQFRCSGSQEEDIQSIIKSIDVLREFKEYFNSHMESWIYEEASMIYEGAVMSDDLSEEEDFLSEDTKLRQSVRELEESDAWNYRTSQM